MKPRWGLRTAVVLVAVLCVVAAAVLIGGNWARHATESRDAKRDRATMQSMCTTVIDTIEGLPGGTSASARAGMADSIAKLRDIADQISTTRPEYQPIAEALSGVASNYGAGRPNVTFPTLIHECALIGVTPR